MSEKKAFVLYGTLMASTMDEVGAGFRGNEPGAGGAMLPLVKGFPLF